MKTYIEKIFEEFVQDDNSTEAKIRRYLERKRREKEEFERNRPRPKTREELQDMIIDAIEKNGPEVDLNYIDVSGIDDMSDLFSTYHGGGDVNKNEILQNFNGDISEWDVSSAKDMRYMFSCADNFNGNISGWKVGSVTDMSGMFSNAKKFSQNISDWDVSRVTNMRFMFSDAKNFNHNISDWKDKLGSVTDMSYMFNRAKNFNQDLSGWDVTGKNTTDMFKDCPIEEEYKPRGLE